MKIYRHSHAWLLSLALLAPAAHAQGAQFDAAETCCLAAEWIAPATGSGAQSDDRFCCIAAEWHAAGLSPQTARPERAVQSGDDENCCLAREWHAS